MKAAELLLMTSYLGPDGSWSCVGICAPCTLHMRLDMFLENAGDFTWYDSYDGRMRRHLEIDFWMDGLVRPSISAEEVWG
jgi:hypothetical protein